jgi:vacuolar-type H+-ATPase subunit E/Vma4
MDLKKMINTIFPDKETRKKSIENNLKETVDEIVKETKAEKQDEYFTIKLIKQYRVLMARAQKYGIDTQDYANKIITN